MRGNGIGPAIDTKEGGLGGLGRSWASGHKSVEVGDCIGSHEVGGAKPRSDQLDGHFSDIVPVCRVDAGHPQMPAGRFPVS